MQGQQGFTIWFTGMPGTGKRTLAAFVAPRLQMIGRRVEVLDGDDIRNVLLGGGNHVQPGEGFEVEVRRLGFLAKMLTRNGVVAICTSISPVREAREEIRKQIGRFVEIYVDCPYEKLMTERERALYRIPGESPVPGHNAPYDVPTNPDLHVDTGNERVEESAARIFHRLREMGYVTREEADVLSGGVEPPPLREEILEEPPQARKAREKAQADREKAEARAAKAAEKAPAKAEKAPAKPEKAPAKSEKAPAKAEKAPAKPEKGAAKEKAPAKAEKVAKAPARPETKPAKAQAKPAKEEKAPAKGASKAAPRREAAAKVAKPAPKAAKPAPKAAKPAPKAKAKGKR